MMTYPSSLRTGALATLVATGAVLGGCAAQGPIPLVGIEHNIEIASSRQDHENIASLFDRQAAVDAAAAKQHAGYASSYRKNKSPRGGGQAQLTLAEHCERLAQTYRQAADENLALATMHRKMAREAI